MTEITCNNSLFKPPNDHHKPQNLTIQTILGLLGCAPLKAGSSTWKAWWWYHLTPDLDHENRSVPGHQPRIAKIPVDDGEKVASEKPPTYLSQVT